MERQSTVCIDCGASSDNGLSLNPTGLWCQEHELERRARITAQMTELRETFAAPAPRPYPTTEED